MAIHNFLVPGARRPVLRGDVVFDIAKLKNGRLAKKRFAHTGIVGENTEYFTLNSSLLVYHMDVVCVREEPWGAITDPQCSCVCICGTVKGLEDVERGDVIQAALRYFHATPAIIQTGESVERLYRMGHAIPLNELDGTYRFTCATFAHQCYIESPFGPLVAVEAIPMVSREERADLLSIFGPSQVPDVDFPRLNPTFLLYAFSTEQYPYHCDDWGQRMDHGAFIPWPYNGDYLPWKES
jgi:hypothetical protein